MIISHSNGSHRAPKRADFTNQAAICSNNNHNNDSSIRSNLKRLNSLNQRGKQAPSGSRKVADGEEFQAPPFISAELRDDISKSVARFVRVLKTTCKYGATGQQEEISPQHVDKQGQRQPPAAGSGAASNWLPKLERSLKRSLSLQPTVSQTAQQSSVGSRTRALGGQQQGNQKEQQRNGQQRTLGSVFGGVKSQRSTRSTSSKKLEALNNSFRIRTASQKLYNSQLLDFSNINLRSIPGAIFMILAGFVLISFEAPRFALAAPLPLGRQSQQQPQPQQVVIQPVWLRHGLVNLDETPDGELIDTNLKQSPVEQLDPNALYELINTLVTRSSSPSELEEEGGVRVNDEQHSIEQRPVNQPRSNIDDIHNNDATPRRQDLQWIQRRRLNRDRALEPPNWLRDRPTRRSHLPAVNRGVALEEDDQSATTMSLQPQPSLESRRATRGRPARQLAHEFYEELLRHLVDEAVESRSLIDELYAELEMRNAGKLAANQQPQKDEQQATLITNTNEAGNSHQQQAKQQQQQRPLQETLSVDPETQLVVVGDEVSENDDARAIDDSAIDAASGGLGAVGGMNKARPLLQLPGGLSRSSATYTRETYTGNINGNASGNDDDDRNDDSSGGGGSDNNNNNGKSISNSNSSDSGNSNNYDETHSTGSLNTNVNYGRLQAASSKGSMHGKSQSPPSLEETALANTFTGNGLRNSNSDQLQLANLRNNDDLINLNADQQQKQQQQQQQQVGFGQLELLQDLIAPQSQVLVEPSESFHVLEEIDRVSDEDDTSVDANPQVANSDGGGIDGDDDGTFDPSSGGSNMPQDSNSVDESLDGNNDDNTHDDEEQSVEQQLGLAQVSKRAFVNKLLAANALAGRPMKRLALTPQQQQQQHQQQQQPETRPRVYLIGPSDEATGSVVTNTRPVATRERLVQAASRLKNYLEDLVGLQRGAILGLFPMNDDAARSLLVKLDRSKLSKLDVFNLVQNYAYARGYMTITWPPRSSRNPIPLLESILEALYQEEQQAAAATPSVQAEDVIASDESTRIESSIDTSNNNNLPEDLTKQRLTTLPRLRNRLTSGQDIDTNLFGQRLQLQNKGSLIEMRDGSEQQRPEMEQQLQLQQSLRLSPLAQLIAQLNSDYWQEDSSISAPNSNLPPPTAPPLSLVLAQLTSRLQSQAASGLPLASAGRDSSSVEIGTNPARMAPKVAGLASDGSFLFGNQSQQSNHWVHVLAFIAALCGAFLAVKLLMARGINKRGSLIRRPFGGDGGSTYSAAPTDSAISEGDADSRLSLNGDNGGDSCVNKKQCCDQKRFNSLRSLWSSNSTKNNGKTPAGNSIQSSFFYSSGSANKQAEAEEANPTRKRRNSQMEGSGGDSSAIIDELNCELEAKKGDHQYKSNCHLLSQKLSELLSYGYSTSKIASKLHHETEPSGDETRQTKQPPAAKQPVANQTSISSDTSNLRSSGSYIKSLIDALAKARPQVFQSKYDADCGDDLENEATERQLVAGSNLHDHDLKSPLLQKDSSTTESSSLPFNDDGDHLVTSQMDISAAHLILNYMEKHLDDKERLKREWLELNTGSNKAPGTSVNSTSKANQLVLQRLAKVALADQNRTKNRNPLVVPFDRNRVKLGTGRCATPPQSSNGRGSNRNHKNNQRQPSSDYINASLIYDDDPRKPTHIIAQGPTEQTSGQFWQMVWEQEVSVIVMLTRLSENGQRMCHCYWPTNSTGPAATSASNSNIAATSSVVQPPTGSAGDLGIVNGNGKSNGAQAKGGTNSDFSSIANRRGSVTSVFNSRPNPLAYSSPASSSSAISANLPSMGTAQQQAIGATSQLSPLIMAAGGDLADSVLVFDVCRDSSSLDPTERSTNNSMEEEEEKENQLVNNKKQQPQVTRFEVQLVSEHVSSNDYLVRNLYLINRSTGEARNITQFHYLAWPDSGVPENVKSFLQFRRKVHKSYRNLRSPILVHCSDGAGRSGTYCLIDIILERIKNGAKEIDPRATLEHLRDQRLGLCSTLSQFEFVLVALAEEIQIILDAMPK